MNPHTSSKHELLTRQLKHNMYRRGHIAGLSIALCRLESNLLRGDGGSFVESMAKPSDDLQHLDSSTRLEDNLQVNFTLDLQAARFRGVLRLRFFQDLNRNQSRRSAFCRRREFPSRGARIAKAAGP